MWWKVKRFLTKVFGIKHKITLGVPAGFYDYDELILQACFSCLCDFMDEADGLECEWSDNEKDQFAYKELNLIYEWWINERPYREDLEFTGSYNWMDDKHFTEGEGGLTSAPNHDEEDPDYQEWKRYCDATHNQSKDWYVEDQDMLHRLINLREYLWV